MKSVEKLRLTLSYHIVPDHAVSTVLGPGNQRASVLGGSCHAPQDPCHFQALDPMFVGHLAVTVPLCVPIHAGSGRGTLLEPLRRGDDSVGRSVVAVLGIMPLWSLLLRTPLDAAGAVLPAGLLRSYFTLWSCPKAAGCGARDQRSGSCWNLALPVCPWMQARVQDGVCPCGGSTSEGGGACLPSSGPEWAHIRWRMQEFKSLDS